MSDPVSGLLFVDTIQTKYTKSSNSVYMKSFENLLRNHWSFMFLSAIIGILLASQITENVIERAMTKF